jgi:hypothetical protein
MIAHYKNLQDIAVLLYHEARYVQAFGKVLDLCLEDAYDMIRYACGRAMCCAAQSILDGMNACADFRREQGSQS